MLLRQLIRELFRILDEEGVERRRKHRLRRRQYYSKVIVLFKFSVSLKTINVRMYPITKLNCLHKDNKHKVDVLSLISNQIFLLKQNKTDHK